MATAHQPNDTSALVTPELLADVRALQSELAAVKARLDVIESKSYTPEERRKFSRQPVKVRVRLLSWHAQEAPIDAEVVDLSRGGLGLIVDTLFVVDSYLRVTSIQNPLGPRVEARVRSRVPAGTRWRIGCEFTQPLTDEELGMFHDS